MIYEAILVGSAIGLKDNIALVDRVGKRLCRYAIAKDDWSLLVSSTQRDIAPNLDPSIAYGVPLSIIFLAHSSI